MAFQYTSFPFILSISFVVLLISYLVPWGLTDTVSPQIKHENDTTADVLIIGGSHAGLSAALTLVRHQVDVFIFDSRTPRNKWKTPIHVLPTWEHREPDELRRASYKELSQTGLVRFVDTHIDMVKRPGKNETLFEVSDAGGRTWKGKKLLLATGVENIFPKIKGYEENFPDRILHCLFTRGLEFRGSQSGGVIAMGLAEAPHHAAILVEDAQKFAERVTVYTNGKPELGQEIRHIFLERGENMISIDNRKIMQLVQTPAEPGIRLELEDGATKVEGFVVHQPDTRVNPGILEQLEVNINDRGDVLTRPPFYQTNIPGVFAAGDCASPFKIIPNAIFQGANAGAGIARELPRRVTDHQVNRVGNCSSRRNRSFLSLIMGGSRWS